MPLPWGYCGDLVPGGGDNCITWATPIPWDAANSTEMDLEWHASCLDAQCDDWGWPVEDLNPQGVAVRAGVGDDSQLNFHFEPQVLERI